MTEISVETAATNWAIGRSAPAHDQPLRASADTGRSKTFGRCDTTTGIVPFMSLAEQAVAEETR